MKKLILLTTLIIAITISCEPNDPADEFSFNGIWEYYSGYSYPTIKLVVNNNTAINIAYNDHSSTCNTCTYTILSSVMDGDTLRVQAKNDTYFLNFISYFTNDQDIMWGRMMRGYTIKPIRYDIPPLKFTRE